MTVDPPDSALIQAIADDLAALAADRGFTTEKARRENLRRLGYRNVGGPPTEDAGAAGLRIALTEILSLLQQQNFCVGRRHYRGAVIAEAALGIGRYTHPSIMARRNDAAAREGAVGSTFASHEPSVFREVARQLLAFRNDPHQLSESLARPVRVLRQAGRERYEQVWKHAEYRFDQRGVLAAVVERMTYRALRDGVDSIVVWHEYVDDAREGVIAVRDVYRAVLSRQEHHNGGHLAELLLAPPLPRGDERTIRLDLALTTDTVCRPRVRYMGTVSDRRPRISLQFDASFRPDEVWWWIQTGIGQEFEPPADHRVQVEPTGFVEHSFDPVARGQNFGLGWRWPTPAP